MWILWFFAVTGAVALGTAIYFAARAHAAKSWPSVPGVITASERSQDAESQSRVTYSYSVAGATFTSDRVMFGDRFGYGLGLNAQADKYPLAGQPVMVRYAPDHPSEAVLELGVSIGAVSGAILGVIGLVIGTVPWWWHAVERLIP